MREFHINPNDAGQRADKFILKVTEKLPGSLLYKAFRKKRIKRNGGKCAPQTLLEQGDVLQLYLNDEFFPSNPQHSAPSFLQTAGDQLDILYEDENLIIVNKPAGLVVHEDARKTGDTLIDRIKRYLVEKGEYHPQEEQSFSPALCNRLDRYTSGLVIAAKNAPALREMSEKIRTREVTKEYLCLALGELEPPAATAKAYLKKEPQGNRVLVEKAPAPGYRQILTRYRVLGRQSPLSLVQVTLLTGRTHQIRAHLAFLGHPLLGDEKYGDHSANKLRHCKNQCLCAYRLTFDFSHQDGVLGYLAGTSVTAPAPENLSRYWKGPLPLPASL